MRVCDLIDENLHAWKDDVLDAVLQEEDVKAARSILLPNSDMADRWIWHYSNRGVYTVSSGNETALGLKRQGMMAGTSEGESSSRYLDKKHGPRFGICPPRINLNILSGNGILPIRENLFSRKVTREMLYMNCKADCETFPHLFFECRFAHIMWRSLPIGFVPDMNGASFNSSMVWLPIGFVLDMNGQASILAWFDNLIDRWKGMEDSDHRLTLATMIMWRIWKCRNEVFHS